MSKSTKQEVIASDAALQTGLNQKYPNATWAVGTQQYTTAQVAALLTQRINANKASDTAHADWLASCATAKDTMQQTEPVIHAVEQRVRAECDNDPSALAVFGLEPTKKGQKSAQVKAQAAVKAAATRKKNNTMGKDQKKEADQAVEQPAAATPPTPPATPAKQ